MLVWCDYPVTTCLFRVIFGIDHPRDFKNFETALVLLGQFQNLQKFTRAIYPKHVITSTNKPENVSKLQNLVKQI